ncbi:armadillo repeat-containing protein 12 isoform X6 [Mustela erminea]|uniref:armadillo repeat-containing protein 12 isoform X6 n=1 Tax=Mustela erminea TaxID=36723 RepID=UPI0013871941|nr:armadillo repeat-containing protein 12 isoform X6 [Mustela erminea]
MTWKWLNSSSYCSHQLFPFTHSDCPIAQTHHEVLSLRFSRSPRLRWSNEVPRGPRIWFLGRGVIEAHHLSTHCFPTPNTFVPVKPACNGSDAGILVPGPARVLVPEGPCQVPWASLPPGRKATLKTWASSCTADDISLVGSMLDEEDNSVKIQALNTLKAFSGIRKFRLKIQEHTIKVLELISTIWDSELHVAGLRLLNSLPLPDYVHPQLRRVMPALMEILQSNYILAQVQAIRLLSYLAQKNDLLYDILNCQVHSNFLNLFQSTQPGSLLFEVLVFAERLSEGRNSPHYRAVKWHYNEQSLHEALFGDESRLADRLLALVIHPEEEVQIQACKVIVSLQCSQDVGVRPSSCRPSHSYFNSGENN